MTPEDRHALTDLDSRIAVMERRLKNAKAARKMEDVILNQMATSDYNWDEEWDRRTNIIQPSGKLRLHEEIPYGYSNQNFH
ncbi:hypothetical protein KIN20_013020 [Parelaphostrongylus tenuis]|uniref:Uncharacterized protein n=1 Tax=Parelaphostrongylus tenuis TaxID=148309 RepID=A0AAD5MU50_PARTN|nr:hypothetical protein KIN20_013020 [Parelaphostrongylus tenuis]